MADPINLTDADEGMDALLRGTPRAVQGILQREAFRMSAFIGESMDRQGPPRGMISTSSRIAIRSGVAFRSTVPGEPGNVSIFQITDAGLLWEYGAGEGQAWYYQLHEYADDYNVHFPARPSFSLGVEAWEAQDLPGVEDEIGAVIEELWGGG